MKIPRWLVHLIGESGRMASMACSWFAYCIVAPSDMRTAGTAYLWACLSLLVFHLVLIAVEEWAIRKRRELNIRMGDED